MQFAFGIHERQVSIENMLLSYVCALGSSVPPDAEKTKEVYNSVCHYLRQVCRRAAVPIIVISISQMFCMCCSQPVFNSSPASETGLWGSVGLWLNHMPPPDKPQHVIVYWCRTDYKLLRSVSKCLSRAILIDESISDFHAWSLFSRQLFGHISIRKLNYFRATHQVGLKGSTAIHKLLCE